MFNSSGNTNNNQMNPMHMQGSPAGGNMSSSSQMGGPQGMGSFPRRLSGGGGFPMDTVRRSSLGGSSFSMDAAVSDILGRRSAGGYDGMGDSMPGARRDNLDSAALIDACILDLTRRRRLMGGNQQGGMPNDMGFGGPQGPAGGANLGCPSNFCPPQSSFLSNMTPRQQQLHAEIEQRKQELEQQRQQLLAGIQETTQEARRQQELINSSVNAGGHNSFSNMIPNQNEEIPSSNEPNPRQQWWVCQICNSKAFASPDEAMDHEAVCTAGPRQMQQQQQQPSAQEMHAQEMQNNSSTYQESETASLDTSGQYAMITQPLPLAMESDKDWLTPLHCFVRRHCVEVFCATPEDVATPSKGKRKPIQVGQVGIRCPHCHSCVDDSGVRERGSVYFPTTISSIYNATMNLLQRHLHSCTSVPDEIMNQYQSLKGDDARSGTSKSYWRESALSLGLVDTPGGIRFSTNTPPPLPRLSHHQALTGANEKNGEPAVMFSSKSNAEVQSSSKTLDNQGGSSDRGGLNAFPSVDKDAPLVELDDKPYATGFSFFLLCQMRPCVFTEADRLGKRKNLPPGFAGLACSHCFGGYGSGRFFPSSIKTLSDTSKTLNVLHNHMMRCRKCPQEVRERLEELRVTHDDERAKMKFGSQKAFFGRIWNRLHGGGATSQLMKNKKRKLQGGGASSYNRPMKQQHMMPPQNYMPNNMMGNMGGLDVLSRQAASAASQDFRGHNGRAEM